MAEASGPSLVEQHTGKQAMVYKKEVPLALKGSASALCNNLSILLNLSKGLISYAVVHKSVVNLISSTTDGSSANHRQVICKEPSATHPSTLVIQARLVAMATRTILVITSQKGIQMFEADGSLMLYWYALGEVAQEEQRYVVHCCLDGNFCVI
ncbi:hypothetical protein CAPTEDRAFT_224602 [Capitella teleta]|uniref:WD repeat-containing protein 54 beta-propeller domain-containing protein n=1 Tax=Capitella teleta TaxID=283909 RepID=R7TKH0_CAPTE|nr:hypothetical protein CAPTEDRAFT_224602 [Capitella teleta]|eukprot:ELT94204.1 hypothetical protein CAPTEDRAFT_224602 [Capitella teleta]